MDDWEVFPREAAAVGTKAIEQGLARINMSYDELYAHAHKIIKRSRDMTHRLMEEGLIEQAPEED
jgi:malate dehydrogenase (oxaloacetate-decarboxylating)